MHELSVANSIIISLEKLKKQNNFSVLQRIKISVGRISGVDAEALRFALESLRKSTLLGSAELDISLQELKIKCNVCGAETEVAQFDFKCASCGACDYEIISGDELEITEIEVD